MPLPGLIRLFLFFRQGNHDGFFAVAVFNLQLHLVTDPAFFDEAGDIAGIVHLLRADGQD